MMLLRDSFVWMISVAIYIGTCVGCDKHPVIVLCGAPIMLAAASGLIELSDRYELLANGCIAVILLACIVCVAIYVFCGGDIFKSLLV